MPVLKDYYAILELEPSATLPEIRKAYRRLAMLFHPDKNPQDPYAQARFTEIKEAYETLTNPSRKEQYLQQRWYNQSAGKKSSGEILTPEHMLKQSLELEKYVRSLDVYRMDKPGLQGYVLDLLSDSQISRLQSFRETDSIRTIIRNLLAAIQPLPLSYSLPVLEKLKQLAGQDTHSLQLVDKHLGRIQQQHRREKYSLLLILSATLLLCLLIWLAGR